MSKLHLIYIDVTQKCNVGCEFCMYEEKRKNGLSLRLDNQRKENLKTIINDSSIFKIAISGEGEPLYNFDTVFSILKLSDGNRSFELITSAFSSINKLE